MFWKGVAHHVHVDARQDSSERRLAEIGGKAVCDQFAHRVIVAQDHALEIPLLAQHLAQRKGIRRRRDAADLVECRHNAGGSLVDRCPERREKDIAQRSLRDVDRVIVLACLRGAIGYIVLGTGRDPAFPGQPICLKPAHAGTRHRLPEGGVLSGALCDPPPSGIPADVDHGRKDPVRAARRRLVCSDPCRPFHQVRVPGARFGEGNGKDGPVPVDHVVAYQQGDTEPRLLDSHALQAVDLAYRADAEHRAHLALAHELVDLAVPPRVELIHLPDFFVEGHAAQDLVRLRHHSLLEPVEPDVSIAHLCSPSRRRAQTQQRLPSSPLGIAHLAGYRAFPSPRSR